MIVTFLAKGRFSTAGALSPGNELFAAIDEVDQFCTWLEQNLRTWPSRPDGPES